MATDAPALRIAFDTTGGEIGSAGVARYVNDLGAALDRRHDIELVRLSAGAAWGRLPGSRIARGLWREVAHHPLVLGRRAKRAGADLLHCPAPLVPQSAGLPWVLTIHDVLPWRYPELFTRANVLQQRRIVAPAARRAARVIVGSYHTRREVISLLGVSPDRVVVTPWGIDRRFRPLETDAMELAQRFGIAPGPFVLAVGTVESHKNLRALLRAFGSVRARVPGCRLVLAGIQDWKPGELDRELGAATDRVVRLGFVSDEDLVRLYGACTCFVFPSLYEGFGFPPLEAMACGAPVVCSNRSSLPEVVGDAGILVDPEDEAALARAVIEVIESPTRARALCEAGRARARGFTWDRCAELTVEAYRAALRTAG